MATSAPPRRLSSSRRPGTPRRSGSTRLPGRHDDGPGTKLVAALLALSLLAGAAWVVKRALDALPHHGAAVVTPELCIVRSATPGAPEVLLDLDQAANAATIAAVGLKMGYGQQAVTIALATAMQESKLRNLSSGDRDSQGLFQQRPSQGWGTPAQVRDPVHASGRFYSRLSKVPHWSSLPVTEAAQAVQRSAFPSAYAQHAADARVIAAALTGHREAGLTCNLHVGKPGKLGKQAIGPTGLTPRAARTRAELTASFGRLSLGGFAPGGISTGHMSGSAHYDGRAIDVFYRPADTVHQLKGWATAQWLVANAKRLQVRTVIYDGRIWTATRSQDGWRPYAPPSGSSGDPDVLDHRDHVHVDVA